MRFKTNLKNIRTFSKLVAALSSLEKIAWMRLDDEHVRFTVIPDTGSQVWALLPMEFIFDATQLQSAEAQNTINLELPLVPLQRALKSALNATSASLRLTKKDGVPILSMTIQTSTVAQSNQGGGQGSYSRYSRGDRGPGYVAGGFGDGFGDDDDGVYNIEPLETHLHREREKTITQDIPVRVLHPDNVEMIMQPKVREPDVHIQLPPLLQLKAISDRFTKLAAASSRASASAAATAVASNPKLELSANMHGSLRLSLVTDTLDVTSQWDSLENPELDPSQLHCPLEEHPSTVFREAGPDKWASVRVDGKDWSRVLSVGRLEGRVIGCFADEHALILYVYVPQYDDVQGDDCVVTYYVSSYST
ncbi:checkpoint protein hus1 [Apiospora arundinis]|uniref:Checkpoint protein n=1 Tax=Apiospora arundinis TaxID=335852 RepID=A0ABR2I1Z9_9PEZI